MKVRIGSGGIGVAIALMLTPAPTWGATEPPAELEPSASEVDVAATAEPAADANVGSQSGSRSPPSASMRGRVGFGAMRTVAGLNGLFVRGFVANRFTLGVHAGVATFSHRDTDEDGEFGRMRTVGRVGVGPEFFAWPVQGDRNQSIHADVGIGLRLTAYVGFLGRLEEERGETLDTPLEIDVEVPVAMQLFVGRRVALLPEFGIVFRIIPGRREPDQNGEFDMNPGTGAGSRLGTTDGPGFGFELGDHAGLFMGIGVAYFFGRLD